MSLLDCAIALRARIFGGFMPAVSTPSKQWCNHDLLVPSWFHLLWPTLSSDGFCDERSLRNHERQCSSPPHQVYMERLRYRQNAPLNTTMASQTNSLPSTEKDKNEKTRIVDFARHKSHRICESSIPRRSMIASLPPSLVHPQPPSKALGWWYCSALLKPF